MKSASRLGAKNGSLSGNRRRRTPASNWRPCAASADTMGVEESVPSLLSLVPHLSIRLIARCCLQLGISPRGGDRVKLRLCEIANEAVQPSTHSRRSSAIKPTVSAAFRECLAGEQMRTSGPESTSLRSERHAGVPRESEGLIQVRVVKNIPEPVNYLTIS
jgi:hypothetical protein